MTTQTPSSTEADLARAEAERQRVLDTARDANREQPRNFKDDALTDKVVQVEPDGTGPTPTDAFDPPTDREAGSGSDPLPADKG